MEYGGTAILVEAPNMADENFRVGDSRRALLVAACCNCRVKSLQVGAFTTAVEASSYRQG